MTTHAIAVAVNELAAELTEVLAATEVLVELAEIKPRFVQVDPGVYINPYAVDAILPRGPGRSILLTGDQRITITRSPEAVFAALTADDD